VRILLDFYRFAAFLSFAHQISRQSGTNAKNYGFKAKFKPRELAPQI